MTSGAELCDSSCAEVRGAGTNVEKIQGFDGTRDSGAGNSKRRRRRKNFWRVCGPVAGTVSGNGQHVRRDARGRGGAPGSIVRDVSFTVRGPHSSDPPRGRERVSEAAAFVARATFGRGRSAQARATDGNGSGAVLSKSRDPCITHS